MPRERTLVVSENDCALEVAQALREGHGAVLVHAGGSPETIIDIFTEMDFIRFLSKNIAKTQLGYFQKVYLTPLVF